MKNLQLTLGLLVIMLVGCSYGVVINPNITPTANIANPMQLKAGLFIPATTRVFTISDSIRMKKYTFHVGEALASIITKSTNRVFSSVEVLESLPTQQMIVEKNLDLTILARVTSGQVSLSQSDGIVFDDAEGSTSLSVQLTFYDNEMHEFAIIGASGMATSSKAIGLPGNSKVPLLSTGQKEFSASVESALRNLSDELVYQIYGNYDIRKKAETP
jgi:hypothetical protein